MKLADFDYFLPPELIALRPVKPRDSSLLLLVNTDESLEDRQFADLPKLLRKGDVLVFNNSKTLPAALIGVRPPRDDKSPQIKIQVNLHKKQGEGEWLAFIKPAKRVVLGDVLNFAENFSAEVKEKKEGGEVSLVFNKTGEDLVLALERVGKMPIPPYIGQKRPVDESDKIDYQTIYGAPQGSVATPTAGLHFTKNLMEKLAAMGVETHFVTLHVGAGTFLPVRTENILEHKMHAEYFELSAKTASAINIAKAQNRRIICVGTTSLRVLESAADPTGILREYYGETDIFLYPGKSIKIVDGLISNFHLPKSTLLMLMCAFSGTEIVKSAYQHAIRAKYRFFSYGDAGLWWRHG
ncbi:MAG: S-adenosylmethionine:tRNA ribosyltransferase-isomerase [Hyphomonadaceae bacterium]|nr:MAG: S-adenosylmethionine:tRNA ribosyltransferase-isomerase [Hyphomonadaceae bacterium]KAF0186350.1 MAG: S-adenosylmethionine:tRNA ribosyltransferase-isomerase [Hyphomonadaceae bacterium]